MNKNTNESWNYAKYRTFCVLSEKMIREYGRAAWMERADELYENVKKKIMELPIAEAEKQMKQVDAFFQSILEGKIFTMQATPEREKKIENNPKIIYADTVNPTDSMEKHRKAFSGHYFHVGEHYMILEKYQDAVKSFEEALEHWKKYGYMAGKPGELFAKYATALQKTGDLKKASEFFQKAEEEGYDCKSLKLKQVQKCKTEEEKIEKKTPQRPRLSLTGTCPKCKKKSYLQFTDGYFCSSCNSLHVTGAMDNKKKDLQERMRKVLFDYKTLPEKSIPELKAMLIHDPHSAQLYGRLGLAYRQIGDNESAMQYYQKAAELDDRDGVIHSNMGVVLSLWGNYYQAKEAFDKAYEYWEKGDYTDWKPEVLFANYSIALHKTGNQEKAFEFLKKAYANGYEDCDTVFMDWGVGKELCIKKIQQLLKNSQYPYSTNLKTDSETFQKVKKHFSIKDGNELFCFFDYTVFGGCKEGLAICADGIHFRMMSTKIKVIKWYELARYEFSLVNGKNITVKKQEKDGSFSLVTMYFLQNNDGNNLLNVLWQMQRL